MTATEIIDIISETIQQAESEAFDATVDARQAEGWASPVTQAQSEWQGHDNGILLGTFADALAELVEHGEAPCDTNSYNPEEDDPQYWLVNHLDSAGVIGDGAPLAYVGVSGYFTLICAGATREEIEQATLDCLPSDYDEEDSD